MTLSGGGDGKLGFTAWPNHVGVCNAQLGQPPFTVAEPTDHPDYRRGQIEWRYANDRVVGRGRIHCPRGDYTHFVYFQGPRDIVVSGIEKMAHTVHFENDGNIIDVDPIYNDDLGLNVPDAPP